MIFCKFILLLIFLILRILNYSIFSISQPNVSIKMKNHSFEFLIVVRDPNLYIVEGTCFKNSRNSNDQQQIENLTPKRK